MTEELEGDFLYIPDGAPGKHMVCPKCRSIVPHKALVCPACAQRRADDGLRASAIARYRAGEAPLYLATASHHHILPLRSGHVLTLCGDARYKTTIDMEARWANKGPLVEADCCVKCWRVLGL